MEMAVKKVLALANGVYPFSFEGAPDGGEIQAIVSTDGALPSAGTVTLETKLIGANQWDFVGSLPLTDDAVFNFSGLVSDYRFTIAGLVGGTLPFYAWVGEVSGDDGMLSAQIGATSNIGVSSNFDTDGNYSECGVGALIPWNDRLYYSTYLAMPGDGVGSRIGYIDRNFADITVLQTDGIHTGRFIHDETQQLCLGCCIIEKNGLVHIIANLVAVRVAGFAKHIVSPASKVYAISMEGKLYEIDLTTYANAVQIMDVKAKLGQTNVHYKACWTNLIADGYANNRVMMASNVQANPTATESGALVAVDPVGDTASIKLQMSTIEVSGNYYPGNGAMSFAIAKDHKSPMLVVIGVNNSNVYRYRLPQWTKAQDWYITQEWMRIRPVTTERMMVNAYGMWYSLSTWLAHASAAGLENFGTSGTDYPIIEPIARYVDTVTDFCVWNGKFAIGTNNMSPP
jgi:hypothetical protein